MKYNFDEIIPRRDTDCIKYDGMEEFYGDNSLLPMWIADMDFKAPPCVVNALRKRVEHEIYGYSLHSSRWKPAIVRWIARRYGWQVSEQEIGFVGGIVPAIAWVLQCFTQEGDKILIQPPVYHPYRIVTTDLGRIPVSNPLSIVDGNFEIDFDDFDLKARDCKVFLLCNPHNPGGRVWTPDELKRMAEICARYNILVVSDEIHCDMTLWNYKHTPFAAVSDVARDNSITLMAASKTFNIAGLKSSYHIIPNEKIRTAYSEYLRVRELGTGHLFATEVVAAAYDEGEEWLDEMLRYVEGNIDYMDTYIRRYMPRLSIIRPQASYLVFLDARELNMTNRQLSEFFVTHARIALNPGAIFGEGGSGYMRFNVGCPRAILHEALERIRMAYETL